MSGKRFTLMGYGEASAWPTVRSLEAMEPRDVMTAAERMLAEAVQCDRVEIWSGGVLVHTLRRAPG